jgi:hypothetical protein
MSVVRFRFSLRAATAPLMRESTAVSTARSSSVAVVVAASGENGGRERRVPGHALHDVLGIRDERRNALRQGENDGGAVDGLGCGGHDSSPLSLVLDWGGCSSWVSFRVDRHIAQGK